MTIHSHSKLKSMRQMYQTFQERDRYVTRSRRKITPQKFFQDKYSQLYKDHMLMSIKHKETNHLAMLLKLELQFPRMN